MASGGCTSSAPSVVKLIVCGGAVSNVPMLLQAALDQFGSPVALASDRWREGEFAGRAQGGRRAARGARGVRRQVAPRRPMRHALVG